MFEASLGFDSEKHFKKFKMIPNEGKMMEIHLRWYGRLHHKSINASMWSDFIHVECDKRSRERAKEIQLDAIKNCMIVLSVT